MRSILVQANMRNKLLNGRSKIIGISATCLSGILFYFSTGFHQYWFLLWLAPLPVLIYAYHYNSRLSAVVAFFAFFIGKLNALYYLGTGMPLLLIIFPIVFNALIFSTLIVFNKWLVSKTQHWLALFLFPALWTSYEFLLSLVSSAGALMSFAYDQLHFLAFIQIVSVTGIWGATFILLTFASGISYASYTKKRTQQAVSLLLAATIPLACIFYGYYRLHESRKVIDSVAVGLISINTQNLIYDNEAVLFSQRYLPLIQQAAKEGAQFIVLPEKFIRVTESTYHKIIPLFQQAANENHVTLILGIARVDKKKLNSAIIINPNGKVAGVYNKHHLLPGLENQFVPGKHFFNVQGKFNWGVAICKDMDFLTLGRHYGSTRTQLLLVPALDFDVDAWYHGRSAVMRGIENGFAIARSAAHGYLSLTDQMGRIISIIPDFHKENNVLVGNVKLHPIHTLYSAWGDWFAWIVLSLLILAIFAISLRLKS